MSGTVGYENVNKAVEFLGNVISGGILLFKKRNELTVEVKDTQIEEVVAALVGPGQEALGKILAAIKA